MPYATQSVASLFLYKTNSPISTPCLSYFKGRQSKIDSGTQSGTRGKCTHDFFLDLFCHTSRNNAIYFSRFSKNRHLHTFFFIRKPYFYV